VGDTTPVEKYARYASPYGVLAMAGNVWEWTSTKWLNNYKDYASKVDNRLEGDEGRVVRGGSFLCRHRAIRCAERQWHGSIALPSDQGFRVVSLGYYNG
jgi:iron(II)-dependent oxidoreductase